MNPDELRIVLIARRYRPLVGGAEKLLERLADEFAAQGTAVVVVTARWEDDWPVTEEQGEVLIERLPVRRARFLGTWSWMRGLEDWLRRNRSRFDVCYVSMLKHSAYAAVGTRRSLGFPVVLRAEGAGPVGDVAWQREANFGRRIARRVRQADAFVALNDEVASELRDAGYPTQSIVQIANGVTIPRAYDPLERESYRRALPGESGNTLADKDPLAVFAGRLSPEKGLFTLIDAWGCLVKSHPTATLLLVGDGPLREDLQTVISQAGLGARIQMTGMVESVEPFHRAADWFVLPSSHEGMSIALLEAMALGLPVVASDIPGNRRVLNSAEQGVLVPSGDAEALASSMRFLVESPDQALQMGRAARDRVEREFSLERMARMHGELFVRLVRQRNAAPVPSS